MCDHQLGIQIVSRELVISGREYIGGIDCSLCVSSTERRTDVGSVASEANGSMELLLASLKRFRPYDLRR